MDNGRLLRILTIVALAITLVLQAMLWFGEGSFMHIHQLRKEIAAQQDQLSQLKARNEILEAQVRSLKGNLDAVEGLARGDLGMIRQGETYYLVRDPDHDDRQSDGKQNDSKPGDGKENGAQEKNP